MSKTAREVITENLYTVTEDAGGGERADKLSDKIISALDAAGFVIAPKEPTKLMIEVGETAVENNCDETQDSYSIYTIVNHAGAARDAYLAMIGESQPQKR